MEAHSTGTDFGYDQFKQQLRLQTDRPTAVREAIFACRKGGSVFVLGVFGGVVDKFPLGADHEQGPDPARRSSTATATSRCCWSGWRAASSPPSTSPPT